MIFRYLLIVVLAGAAWGVDASEDEAAATGAESEGELIIQIRSNIYKDVRYYQRQIPEDDPEYAEKIEESYAVIAEQYGVSEEQVRAIYAEGREKSWAEHEYNRME